MSDKVQGTPTKKEPKTVPTGTLAETVAQQTTEKTWKRKLKSFLWFGGILSSALWLASLWFPAMRPLVTVVKAIISALSSAVGG